MCYQLPKCLISWKESSLWADVAANSHSSSQISHSSATLTREGGTIYTFIYRQTVSLYHNSSECLLFIGSYIYLAGKNNKYKVFFFHVDIKLYSFHILYQYPKGVGSIWQQKESSELLGWSRLTGSWNLTYKILITWLYYPSMTAKLLTALKGQYLSFQLSWLLVSFQRFLTVILILHYVSVIDLTNLLGNNHIILIVNSFINDVFIKM